MPPTCILTDSSVQFSSPTFPGQELVHLLPLVVCMDGQRYPGGRNITIEDFPKAPLNGKYPYLEAPKPEDVRQHLSWLGQRYTEVVVILLSGALSPIVEQIRMASAGLHSAASFQVIDSLNTGVGLGLLVQNAAKAAAQGANAADITRLVYKLSTHIYTVFCTRSLVYLQRSGQLDVSQAIAGEILGLNPFFILESGRWVPLQKAQNHHQLFHFFIEFASEFNDLEHIALIDGAEESSRGSHLLRDRLETLFPRVAISEHILEPTLGTLVGPHSMGMVLMEKSDEHFNRNR